MTFPTGLPLCITRAECNFPSGRIDMEFRVNTRLESQIRQTRNDLEAFLDGLLTRIEAASGKDLRRTKPSRPHWNIGVENHFTEGPFRIDGSTRRELTGVVTVTLTFDDNPDSILGVRESLSRAMNAYLQHTNGEDPANTVHALNGVPASTSAEQFIRTYPSECYMKPAEWMAGFRAGLARERAEPGVWDLP